MPSPDHSRAAASTAADPKVCRRRIPTAPTPRSCCSPIPITHGSAAPLAKRLYKRVAKCRPLVQQIVDEKLDAIGNAKTFDAMVEFALLVPIDAIARILGVDNARLKEFRAWSEDVILSLNPFCTP